jgi:hypothetical protein
MTAILGFLKLVAPVVLRFVLIVMQAVRARQRAYAA